MVKVEDFRAGREGLPNSVWMKFLIVVSVAAISSTRRPPAPCRIISAAITCRTG